MRSPVRLSRSRITTSITMLSLVLVAVAGCVSDSSSSSPDSNPKSSFCNLLLSFRATNDALSDEVASGDNTRAQAVVQRLVDQIELLQDRAPADIKSDVDVVAGFVHQFDDVMAAHNYNLDAIEADPAAAEEISTILDDTVNASLDQLRAYAEQDCASLATTDGT